MFGATGPSGRCLLEQGLARGHQVTAFVRTPGALGIDHPRLQEVVGDALDPEAVAGAVRGQDAVLSALGPRRRASRNAENSVDVCSRATGHIVAGMKLHGVTRLIAISAVGVGASRGQGGFLLERILIPLFLRQAFADKEEMERIVRGSGLDWVVVQPVMLTDAAATGTYRVALEARGARIASRVSRADVAHFMISQVEEDQYLGTTPAIAA